MNIIKYPNDEAVNKAMAAGEPLLVLISFDGETVIISQSAPIDKALYFGILPIYRAFLRLLCAIFFILCKVFLTENNAFLTRIAHEIAQK